MNCPKCQTSMEPVTFGDIEVDRCTACHGMWFDALEKEHLAHLKGSEVIDLGTPTLDARPMNTGPLTCPRCKSQLIRMADTDHRDVQIESCTVCYGTFLDAGEFRDMKEYSVREFLKKLFRIG